MTYRISITIPDELYDRLQLYKDQFNISQAAAMGINSAIETFERQKQLEQMAQKKDIAVRRFASSYR